MRREWSLKDSFLHTEEGVFHAMPLGRGARREAPALISRQRKWEEHKSEPYHGICRQRQGKAKQDTQV